MRFFEAAMAVTALISLVFVACSLGYFAWRLLELAAAID